LRGAGRRKGWWKCADLHKRIEKADGLRWMMRGAEAENVGKVVKGRV
jgi:hypothetical protein